ncbi:exopolysaccharide production protein YjbE [Enterobacter asburiae]|uniref:exopolysaccharide production protein YjbE n=1 Tax=Enterobacter asburiae TaxID=61645 RepID=UPI001FFFCDEB|nr:exopolysaccharide production protein YjbE [Enterobacter asburiae]MCK2178047.1 exopolysaccharide production protein YjbE [Enterobacter asburiae]
MRKILYGIFIIYLFAAISAYAVPVQVGEPAGSSATSVAAGISTAASVGILGLVVGGAIIAMGGDCCSNTGTTTSTIPPSYKQ